MYTTISSVYDYIFPQNPKQLSFIESIQAIDRDEKIIEIGAATGNLTDLLMSKSTNVIGLDLDEGLLNVAKKKYPSYQFVHKNMLEINQMGTHFDKVICLGNTLVHLPNRDLVQEFFNAVYGSLNKDGYLITQIINYDRILEDNINHLSTIDNQHIKFKRNYVLHDDYLDFNTELLIKSSDQMIENSIPLLTLRREEIRQMLIKSGFTNIKFYGGLDGSQVTSNSVPLLFSCQK
jgi:cyclopropane fatty-acyl-phospholipid synthase-like methyltransferase